MGASQHQDTMGQIALGLRELHRRGIIHRDIKNTNIVAADERFAPRWHIIDYGLARVCSQDVVPCKGNAVYGAPCANVERFGVAPLGGLSWHHRVGDAARGLSCGDGAAEASADASRVDAINAFWPPRAPIRDCGWHTRTRRGASCRSHSASSKYAPREQHVLFGRR